MLPLFIDDIHAAIDLPILCRPTNTGVGRRACIDWHYSSVLPPNLHVCYGFWRGDIFDGIIAFREINPPPVLRYWTNVIGGRCVELCRMAFRSQSERPPTTQYISLAMDALRREGLFEGVYSYADDMEGHVGTVYRAASFVYAGYAERGVAGYRHPDGRVLIGRREMNAYAGDAATWVNALVHEGFVAIPGKKHRYVKGLTRKARKRLERQRDILAQYKQYWHGHRRTMESIS